MMWRSRVCKCSSIRRSDMRRHCRQTHMAVLPEGFMPTTVQPFHRMWSCPLCNFRTPSISDSTCMQPSATAGLPSRCSGQRGEGQESTARVSGIQLSRSSSASRTKWSRSPCRKPRVRSVSVARSDKFHVAVAGVQATVNGHKTDEQYRGVAQ